MLTKLYEGQRGRVRGQRDEAWFQIERRTKEGDPLSARIFALLVSNMMRKLREDWKRKGYGYELVGEKLCDLSYADDVLLVARTKEEMAEMLQDLVKTASKYCVKLNWDPKETKVMDLRGRRRNAVRAGANGEIREVPVAMEAEYLGRYFSRVGR